MIRLTSEGEAGLIDLPRLGRELHHTTRVLRVFLLESGDRQDPRPLLDLLSLSESEAERRLESGEALYTS